jgi:hypothetical protein
VELVGGATLNIIEITFWSAYYQTCYDLKQSYFVGHLQELAFVGVFGYVLMPIAKWALGLLIEFHPDWLQRVVDWFGLNRGDF